MVALDDIRAATSLPVRPVVVARSELRKVIDRLQREDNDLGDVAASLRAEQEPIVSSLTTGGDDAPIVRYVNSILDQAIQNRASDIHLEPTEGDLRIRYRIDGVLHEVDVVPRAVQAALISRLKIMSNVDITERRVPQNGRITVQLGQRMVDLRAATLPTVWGEKIVLRVLDTGGIDLELKKLGFTDDELRAVRALVHQAARHVARHRPDRVGQVDDPVRDAVDDQQADGQRDHRRGPGRVPAARRQPGAGQPQGRPDLRRRAARDPAV